MARTEQVQPDIALGADKTKVFISYSRRDSTDFADELVAGLELAGFDPFLDRHDIVAGEDWEARLGGLIAQSDTVVFVVSPEAVASERCIWEVEKTLALSKRLLPVIFKPVPDSDIPESLRRLQFVRFDLGRGVSRPMGELAAALRADLGWIREHTRLGELAARWDARGRPPSLLLRGDEVDAAKAWMARRKTEAPPISESQRAFIGASQDAEGLEKERSRRLRGQMFRMWAFVGVLVLGIGVGLAWSNRDYLEVRAIGLAETVWPRTLTSDAERTLSPLQRFRECVHCPEMVVIPGGKFIMGSSPDDPDHRLNEGPQHEITVARSFAVSRFEITSAEWDACVLLGGCAWPAPEIGWGRGRLPVMNVNWDDAHQYVRWLSRHTGKHYRLLTEAEWEYAARAGSTTAYFWGDTVGTQNANCKGCGSRWDARQNAPVGSFAPNAFGLHDMHGNVWEWVQDCYNPSLKGAPTDGSAWTTGDCSLRIVRGGSWFFEPVTLRSARRGHVSPDYRVSDLGFRVARPLAP